MHAVISGKQSASSVLSLLLLLPSGQTASMIQSFPAARHSVMFFGGGGSEKLVLGGIQPKRLLGVRAPTLLLFVRFE